MFIARPPEAVTRVILDSEQAARWTTDLERFEGVAGNAGEPGAVARLYYLQNGRPYGKQDELLEADPSRRYRSRVSGEAVVAEVVTTLIPDEGGTRLAIRWTGSGRRFPVNFMLPLMRRSILRQAEADLNKFKELVEREAPDLGVHPRRVRAQRSPLPLRSHGIGAPHGLTEAALAGGRR